MNVVALPGRRIETHAWMKSLVDAAQYAQARIVRYRHWDGETEASVPFEAQRLAAESPQLVVAKSMGTVIAATAYGSHAFRPAFAILVGTPFAALGEDDVGRLRRFAAGVTTLFIQQTDDPGGRASQLAATLDLRRGEVAEVPGSDHLYLDIDDLAATLRRWHDKVGLPPAPAV